MTQYDPPNPYDTNTRGEMMAGELAPARFRHSELAARRGLTASALDEMLIAQWDGGKEQGYEDGRGDVREARRRAFEEGVAMACVTIEHATKADLEVLDDALGVRPDRRKAKLFTAKLTEIRRRAAERLEWAQRRPTTIGTSTTGAGR